MQSETNNFKEWDNLTSAKQEGRMGVTGFPRIHDPGVVHRVDVRSSTGADNLK